MSTTTAAPLNYRDRAVLRAVAAGRCEIKADSLTVDGYWYSDQFAGLRLADAGLISTGAGRVLLTRSGSALLAAA